MPVPPTTPPPPTANERLAEQFGQFSAGFAARGGSGRLAGVLVALISLIMQALRAIAETRPAASRPSAPEPALPSPPKTPRRGQGHRRSSPRLHRAGEPSGRTRAAPEAQRPPARSKTPRRNAPRTTRPGARQSSPGAVSPNTTVPKSRPRENRAPLRPPSLDHYVAISQYSVFGQAPRSRQNPNMSASADQGHARTIPC